MSHKILLVDDEDDILDMLGDFLTENGYAVETAHNGVEALAKLANDAYDLILSDINMPKMKGFELLREAIIRYPKLKSALITAYNVNDYIRMARDEDVGNIISKTSPFNFNEVLFVVKSLVTEEIFGLSRYMKKDAIIKTYEIKHSRQIDRAIENATEFFGKDIQATKLNLVLREIVTNAVFYGARNEAGDEKEKWDTDVALNPGEYVDVLYGRDDEKIGVAVVDHKGRLKKKDVLYWLDRNISRSSDGLPLSMHDIHGRGLYISRETIDRFIVNIRRNEMTEIITLLFLEKKYKGYHPLLINEL